MVETRLYDKIGRDKIRDFLKDCKKIADLGCNEQKIREDAIGYDIDPDVNPDYEMDLLDEDFELAEKYDGICMSHFLEHVIDVRGFLNECFISLNEGGHIAIVVPDGESVLPRTLGDSGNTHEMLFTPKTLALYLKNMGFKEVESEYYGRPYAYRQNKSIFARGIK